MTSKGPIKIEYDGDVPKEVLGYVRKKGDVFEVESEEVANDLLRRPDFKTPGAKSKP
jgi:hypothetical protein